MFPREVCFKINRTIVAASSEALISFDLLWIELEVLLFLLFLGYTLEERYVFVELRRG